MTHDEIRIGGKLILSRKENPKEWASLGLEHSRSMIMGPGYMYINGRRVLLSEGRLETRFAAFLRRVRRLLVFSMVLVAVGLWIKRRVRRDHEEESREKERENERDSK